MNDTEPDISESLIKISEAENSFAGDIASAQSVSEIENIRVRYLGKKGLLTEFTGLINRANQENKKTLGQQINKLKQSIQAQLTVKTKNLEEEARIRNEKTIDVALPGRRHRLGTLHPLTLTSRKVCSIFNAMGFLTVDGPEIETDYYNFEALNIPSDHPTRDDQDSFFIKSGILLRTQTSPVQIRVMKKTRPPFAIIAPGRVYRRDTSDASHSPIFHQIEGLYVAEHVTFCDLKGILHNFCIQMFGKDRRVRFRPDFFPFTEPSCEISISCARGGGKGCATCGGDGWLEILGAGMVNPAVLKNVNLDPEIYSGLAFGMGIERIAMLTYDIHDIRLFFENNYQFLGQFPSYFTS